MKGGVAGLASVAVGRVAGMVGLTGVSKFLDEQGNAMVKAAQSSIRSDLNEEAKMSRGAGGGGRTLSRKVGFGEQEEAMTSINKSFKQTNKALSDTAGSLRDIKAQVSKLSSAMGITEPSEQSPGAG